MNVAELLAALASMPPDATVRCVWDGEPRSAIRHVWLALSGGVNLADQNDVVYDPNERPAGAVEDELGHWYTPRVTGADDE